MIDAEIIVEKQRAWFQSGKTLSFRARLDALEKLAAEARNMETEIVAALHKDLRKSTLEAYMCETNLLQEEIAYAQKNLQKWMRKRKTSTPVSLFPAKCFQVPEPYGIVLILSPWNYPFLLTLQPLVGAIAAGNCAVIKPSAYAPATSKVIKKLISECFPEEYCAVIEGGRAENTALLRQKFDYIFFTGSVSVGKTVMKAAAEHLTPVTLELGGKSPVVIDETADLSLAAKRLVFAKFMNAGQTCVSPDYVLVTAEKREELIRQLRHFISLCYPKGPDGTVTDYPRIINRKHFDRLCGLMAGQTIAVGGTADGDSLTIEPTVLTDVTWDAPIMQEEIFGPVLPILTYDDLDDAIAKIQSRPKPLALYLFSENKAVWKRFEQTVSFGGGCINDCMVHLSSHTLPFGGVGESGMGQYHGKASFDTFTHCKSIVNKSTKMDMDVRYRPYDAKKEKMIRSQ
ncbi:MAG: aldehyde dehydrogenase [Faecousia sp.]